MSAAPFDLISLHHVETLREPDLYAQQMRSVAEQRDQWLARGLCAEPSDRSTAESAVAQLYRRVRRPDPQFVWVPSPLAGSRLIADEGLSETSSFSAGASTRIAALIVDSSRRMAARIERRRHGWQDHRYRQEVQMAWSRTPEEAARAGVGPDPILRAAVWDSLRTSLFDGVAAAIRTLMLPTVGMVTWYGQQEAHRLAYYSMFRQCGLVGFHSDDVELLAILGTLAGATGWWWAFDDVCVMSERPTVLHTEPIPDRVHNQHRLHHSDEPAVEFADGARVYAHHGTILPDWVVLDPTVERIARERNVEVRRCAIERIGWDTYIDAAGLAMVDHADDPGNADCTLQLYATPMTWGADEQILLAVNGSRERDGHRRRYGLRVPRHIPTALDAAGWTYGISGSDYSRLVRRT